MTATATFDEFMAEVVRLLRERWRFEWSDDGRDELPTAWWTRGETPAAFVQWYAQEYELLDPADFGVPAAQEKGPASRGVWGDYPHHAGPTHPGHRTKFTLNCNAGRDRPPGRPRRVHVRPGGTP